MSRSVTEVHGFSRVGRASLRCVSSTQWSDARGGESARQLAQKLAQTAQVVAR
jgi:hypothetical protein